MARLEGLRVYPVKGLDSIDLEAAEVLEVGPSPTTESSHCSTLTATY